MTSTLIHSARIVDEVSVTEDAWVLFRDGVVAARGVGYSPEAGEADEVVDAAGQYLAPGFIDLHVHGGAGATLDEGVAAVSVTRDLHRAHGTTRALLSLVTAPLADLAARTAALAPLVGTQGILGLHLEGPFLAASHRGAHPEPLLRAPEAADLDLLLDAGADTVRQVTVAPELAGGIDAIERLVRRDVIAAVGHTGADADTTRRAIDAGVRLLTHAFNGMPPIHHRSPGPIPIALTDERVTVELIADGVHVDPAVIRLAFDAAAGRVALITDAMAAAGAPDGDYMLAGQAVRVEQGIARVASEGAIAGSTLTQDHALGVAVASGVPLAVAVDALTRVPAAVLGEEGRYGSLRVGAVADAVLLDDDLLAARVWVDGATA